MMALAAFSHSAARIQAASPAMLTVGEKAGRDLYLTYCAACHGRNGEGQKNWQQPNVLGELTAPPHNAEGHTWRHADSDLFTMIAKGWRDPFNRTKRLTMPPFKETLKSEEITDLITYLKTLWTAEQRQFQQEESLNKSMSPSRSSTQSQDME
jgi:mono/diheme cytochrome c family protein